jgi:hypothetical protein
MKEKISMLYLLSLLSTCVTAQSFSEKINKELSFEKKGNNALMVFNLNGHIKVVGYAGDKILVEVEKVVRAKSDARLEKGKASLQLGVIDLSDTLILYIKGVCSDFDKHKNSGAGHAGNWGYSWGDCRHNDCREEYDYEMNFTVKVPATLNVYASTVNDGDVTVENVAGNVSANNINGSILLKSISGPTYASTINGGVDLEYSQNPNQDCRYYSLNGDINANFRKGLTANVSFESFNGDLYTNVEELETVPAMLEKKSDGQGIRYKIGGSRYRIGKGGILLDFETFNGNVYLKEKTN